MVLLFPTGPKDIEHWNPNYSTWMFSEEFGYLTVHVQKNDEH